MLLRISLHLKIVCPEKKEKKVEGDKEFHATAKTIRIPELLSYSVMWSIALLYYLINWR